MSVTEKWTEAAMALSLTGWLAAGGWGIVSGSTAIQNYTSDCATRSNREKADLVLQLIGTVGGGAAAVAGATGALTLSPAVNRDTSKLKDALQDRWKVCVALAVMGALWASCGGAAVDSTFKQCEAAGAPDKDGKCPGGLTNHEKRNLAAINATNMVCGITTFVVAVVLACIFSKRDSAQALSKGQLLPGNVSLCVAVSLLGALWCGLSAAGLDETLACDPAAEKDPKADKGNAGEFDSMGQWMVAGTALSSSVLIGGIVMAITASQQNNSKKPKVERGLVWGGLIGWLVLTVVAWPGYAMAKEKKGSTGKGAGGWHEALQLGSGIGGAAGLAFFGVGTGLMEAGFRKLNKEGSGVATRMQRIPR